MNLRKHVPLLAGSGLLAVLCASVFAVQSLADDASLGLGCIKSTPPDVKSVARDKATLEFKYKDECGFPANSFIESRRPGGTWADSHSEGTKRTGRGWRTREITLRNLKAEERYQARSGITYFSVDHSSPIDFFTGFKPAKDLTMEVAAGRNDVHVILSGLTSPGGRNVANLLVKTGDESEQVRLDRDGANCEGAGDGRQRCEWFEQFVVIDRTQPFNGIHMTRGESYTMRVKLFNKVYQDAFGGQVTLPVTVTAGIPGTTTVGENTG